MFLVVDFLAEALVDVLVTVADSSETAPGVLWAAVAGSVNFGTAASSDCGGCSGVSMDGCGGGFEADCRRVRVLGPDCDGVAGVTSEPTLFSADASGRICGLELDSNCDDRLVVRRVGATGNSFSNSVDFSTAS